MVASSVDSFPPFGRSLAERSGALNSLSIAWRTELLLDLTASALADDEFVKLANTWAVVQVYYVFYHCTQALAQAKGFGRTPSHPKTQNLFHDFWAGGSAVIPPWTFSVVYAGPRSIPTDVIVDDSIHPWNACDQRSCWSLAAKALRTTRQYSVDEAIARKRMERQRERKRAWEQAEGNRLQRGLKARKQPRFRMPQLSREEKTQVHQRVRSNTVMDYLYRLRIRTNYEDSAMFTDGPEFEGDSTQVLDNLRCLSAATLLIHELALSELLGRDTLLRQVGEFLGWTAPSGIVVSLRHRLGILEQHARDGV